MNWLDFIVLTLAGSGILEAWFKGSLFGRARELMKLKDDAWENPPTPTEVTPSAESQAAREEWRRRESAWRSAPAQQRKLTSEPFPEAPPEIVPEPMEEGEEPFTGYLAVLDRWVPNWVGAMLSCEFCFSYHACFWFGLAFWVPSLFLAEPWSMLIKFPLYALAATRLGNILTGMLPPRLRYKELDDEPAWPDGRSDHSSGSAPEDIQ